MDRDISRREYLKATGIAGLTATAGCVDISGVGESSVGTVTVGTLPSEYTLIGQNDIVLSSDVQSSLNVQRREQLRVNRDVETPQSNESEGENNDSANTEEPTEPEPIRPALFTIRESEPFPADNGTALIPEEILNILPIEEGDSIDITTTAPSPDLNTSDEARQNNELVTQQASSNGDDYLMIAPYGGGMENRTGSQAVRAGSRADASSFWAAFGYDNFTDEDSYHRWRVNATDINPTSYPKIDALPTDRYSTVVSFVGGSNSGIRISGLGRDAIKSEIRSEIRSRVPDYPVRTVPSGADRSDSPANLANRLSQDNRNGIIIRQSEDVRRNEWRNVADGVVAGLQNSGEDSS